MLKKWFPWLPNDVITMRKKWKKSVATYKTLKAVSSERKDIFQFYYNIRV